MTQAIDWYKAAPDVFRAQLQLQVAVNESGLEHSLLELVKLRASQINGCGYCIDMHTKDARAAGETEQRLYLLSVWHESAHLYTARERAALAWTEAVTLIHTGPVSEAVTEAARKQFSEAELARLTLAVVAINGWNRLSIAFHTPVGGYQPGMFRDLKIA